MDPVARGRELGATLRRLADLVEKYRLLEALRLGEPGRTVVRRDAMREIAGRFPAAMREWDEAPPEEITRRRQEVERVLALWVADVEGGAGRIALAAPECAWIRYSAEIHERLRAALAIKRWLAGRPITDEIAASAERLLDVDRPRLERIAAPPEGRLAQMIYAEVAALHGVPVAEMKAFLFPPRRDDDGDDDEEDPS